MEDLFSMSAKTLAPLADRMRPRNLDEFVGQEQIIGKDKLLRRALERAIADPERGYGLQDVKIDEAAMNHIVSVANGDARSALNALELAVLTTPMEADGATHITLEVAEE